VLDHRCADAQIGLSVSRREQVAYRAQVRITTRNARFQQWQALLTNRTKRQRAGEFLVQGVRPITQAVARDWPLRAMLYRDGGELSQWARDLLDRVGAPRIAVAADLLGELSDKDDRSELIAVAAIPEDNLGRIPLGPTFFGHSFLGVVFDRPASPGNIGTLLRSADAFGAGGVIVTGHAADVYDPKSVRASTGSLFSVPAVRVSGHREVLDWAAGECTVIGADESADADVYSVDLTGPTLLVVGNETVGLSAAWREACDVLVRIPMTDRADSAASSLNAATAASILLYEAARQRRLTPRHA
jgi:23S rRNA (uridine2479-2'-O)-methyltransferase